ncbi:transcription-repair coupling factor [Propionicicella superfundia]|uniref:transcription-repair coupling factor n=1 Tax=Propionicicella superfundia TaxID=348582 RepID=UPI00040F3056|nr:transcription-repair coupling factor [Propionicicella superfundia]
MTPDPLVSAVLARIGEQPNLRQAVADHAATRTFDLAGPAAMRPFVTATLARETGRTLLLVCATYREAEAQTAEIASLLGEDAVAYYPAWETLPHERLSPRSDTVGRRLAVLRRFAGTSELPAPRVVVAPVRSLLQPQVAGLGDLRPVELVAGGDYDLADVARSLVDAAYVRVDLVQRRGEFAVRGGIIDVFPPTEEHPLRADFFGDTLEGLRHFAVADQRSFDEPLDRVIAYPCRELLLTPQVRARARTLADTDGMPAALVEMCDRIAEGHAVDGMESLSAVLVDRLELLVDVLPGDALVLVAEPEAVRARAIELAETSAEFLHAAWTAAAEGGTAPVDLAGSAYRTLAQVRRRALDRGQSWWGLSPFSAGPDVAAGSPLVAEDGEVVDLSEVSLGSQVESASTGFSPVETIAGTDAALAAITTHLADRWDVVLAAETEGLAKRLAEVLGEAGVPVARQAEIVPGVVNILVAEVRHGLLAPEGRFALLSSGDLTGRRDPDRGGRKLPARRRNQIDPLELADGDPVVHQVHGVGRYVEMVQRDVQGSTREYLVIEFAPSKRGQPGDRLYLPMDQLDQITRYVGGENPSLDRLGGGDWSKRKSRARKAVREIAAELIKLYAARQASRGHAFSPDTVWQQELEDSFSHVETPDQLSAIDEVKTDMEQVVPMDRLICGDVGYGKTEIAVRAAFKAVQDGKQVAVLVPTTLLVQQHHQTFADRYAGFPINVAPLSRFQSAAEAKATVDGLATGAVDVVVGTHRLLSPEIAFKDLGLVIIDEEQRFGVEHKEALKKLRLNVDVLAMSATPIPRTLEMAVTGIRELSVIATPPEERHPVLTFAGPYDEAQVTAAIRRELAREGQVFFIHNRVSSIEKVATRLQTLVPDARVAVAHGQMGEARLEKVMVDFWERRADVLVCTTIVEAGLDISTANTLLIDRADRFGLSQLHQLRGRVGRGRERGYAYFLYPPDKPLTETAHDRLATMAAHTDLGAGMQIAMKDLEIRGAGNLLGGEQSGHIADVGFDLYLRLVGEAVAEFRGEDVEPEPELRIELPVTAHLPVPYIESERLRLEMYKRIAEVRTPAELDAVRAELQDRYGEPPEPVRALLAVADFRLLARRAGLTEVIVAGQAIRFGPVAMADSRRVRMQRLYPGAQVRAAMDAVLIPAPRTSGIPSSPVTGLALLDWCGRVVSDLFLPA